MEGEPKQESLKEQLLKLQDELNENYRKLREGLEKVYGGESMAEKEDYFPEAEIHKMDELLKSYQEMVQKILW